MTCAWNTAGASTHTSSIQWDSSWPAFVPEPQRSGVLAILRRALGYRWACLQAIVYWNGVRSMCCCETRRMSRPWHFCKSRMSACQCYGKFATTSNLLPLHCNASGRQATRHTIALTTSQMAQLLGEHRLPVPRRLGAWLRYPATPGRRRRLWGVHPWLAAFPDSATSEYPAAC